MMWSTFKMHFKNFILTKIQQVGIYPPFRDEVSNQRAIRSLNKFQLMGRAHNAKMYVMNNMRNASQMASSYRPSGYKKLYLVLDWGIQKTKAAKNQG